jgi:polygalacturonase
METTMKQTYKPLIGILLTAFACAGYAQECNPYQHGGKPNDDVLDTQAIQKAIDACAQAGGGRVHLSPGIWMSGSLFMRSNIDLHIAQGATLMGSASMKDYRARNNSSNSHSEAQADGLIIAEKVVNASISGFGTVDGQGEKFWDPGFLASGKARPTLPRPMPWIEFSDSSRITVRDVTFQNSPSYGVAFTRSTDIEVQRIRVINDPRSPNTDGIQVNDSKRVNIRGVYLATGDDAIVLKSDDGDVEDVVVSDSILTSDDTAFKFGTGSKKSIRRVTLRDSTMIDSRIGVGFFMRRGGVYEDVEIRNVKFVGRSRSNMEWPIYIDVDRRGNNDKLGIIRDVRIDGMRIEGRGNILIAGNPDSVMENISLKDIEFTVTNPVDLANAFNNKPRGNVTAGIIAGTVDYSKDRQHITLGHIRNLTMDGIRINGAPADVAARTPIGMMDVVGASIKNIDIAPRAASPDPLVSLKDSANIVVAAAALRAGDAPTPAVALVGKTERLQVQLCKLAVSDCSNPPGSKPEIAEKKRTGKAAKI